MPPLFVLLLNHPRRPHPPYPAMPRRLQSPQNPPAVSKIRIDAESAGQRIDNFLLRHYKGVPKSRIYRILRRGEVRVNKGRARPAYKLSADDELRLPPVRAAAIRRRRPPDTVLAKVAARVVYEDERVIVLNKPAGLSVHAGTGADYGVIDALRETRQQPVYLAHRLDMDTSGCLLLARDRAAMLSLQRAMRDGAVEKHYTALLMGGWGRGRQTVRIPLSRPQNNGGMTRADAAGKPAATVFSPVREYARGDGFGFGASLMKIRLLTGRTHQIRAHAGAVGHPVAGDRRYGDAEFNRAMKLLGLRRMFLHAASLRFPHPDNDRPILIEPPLDEDLQAVLDNLDAAARPTSKRRPARARRTASPKSISSPARKKGKIHKPQPHSPT